LSNRSEKTYPRTETATRGLNYQSPETEKAEERGTQLDAKIHAEEQKKKAAELLLKQRLTWTLTCLALEEDGGEKVISNSVEGLAKVYQRPPDSKRSLQHPGSTLLCRRESKCFSSTNLF